jgi:hypothetical protein
MEIAEIRRQRILAHAELERLDQLWRRGSATDEMLQEQRSIYEQIRDYELAQTTKPKSEPTTVEFGTRVELPEIIESEKLIGTWPREGLVVENQFTEEQMVVLNSLKSELEAIDLKKNALGNALAKIPKDVNARNEVQAIKALKELWRAKGDEIYYFQKHGALPHVPTEDDKMNDFEKKLPRDKYELEKLRKNLLPNLSKYKKALSTAKTPAKVAHYKKMITQAELKLHTIETLISGL